MALHKFWTILIDNAPTAFRARTREELQPTWRQIHRTQPGATLVWFERGKVWAAPEEAVAALAKARADGRPRSHRTAWRPGGEHRDPKARPRPTRDARRAQFKSRQRRARTRPSGDSES